MKSWKSCFLIDDDIDDQEIFLMALNEVHSDINCLVANDGIQGLKQLSEDVSFIPDVIFVDLNIPKMNGLQCLPEIKKLDHLKDVRVVMFSTSADPKTIKQSKELGAFEFLMKPCSLQGLVDALAGLMNKELSPLICS